MEGYDDIRRGLAEAMGWRVAENPATGFWWHAPGEEHTRFCHEIPDPLNNAEDAEALEAWLLHPGRGGYYVRHSAWATTVAPVLRMKPPKPWVRIRHREEPDGAKRRRMAIILAAWKLLQQAGDGACPRLVNRSGVYADRRDQAAWEAQQEVVRG